MAGFETKDASTFALAFAFIESRQIDGKKFNNCKQASGSSS